MPRKKFTCPTCGGHIYGTGTKGGVETGFCLTSVNDRTCSFNWPRSDDGKYIRRPLTAPGPYRPEDEDTDVIDEGNQVDDLTAVMRDVSNELRRVAETGAYKGYFVDPVVEKAAQAIKKLYEEAAACREKSAQ